MRSSPLRKLCEEHGARVSPVLKIPPELEKDVTVLDLEMPNEAELAAVLDETIEQMKDNPKVEVNLEGGGREKIVKALSGLTRSEAENALAKIIVTNSCIDAEDVALLLSEKEQIIRKSGMLEYYASPERFGSIGGGFRAVPRLRGGTGDGDRGHSCRHQRNFPSGQGARARDWCFRAVGGDRCQAGQPKVGGVGNA